MEELQRVKESLTIEQIYELVNNFGGNPVFKSFGLVADTICHNLPGEGSQKLYYYQNTQLFSCFTGCQDRFDIVELTCKVFKVQRNIDLGISAALDYITNYFGITREQKNEFETLDNADAKIFQKYAGRANHKSIKGREIIYEPYDDSILNRFSYIPIVPWLKEGISQEVMNEARIGYYPGGEQITIPHYDYNGRFIGLRGRSLIIPEAEKYGKYRPLRINGILYNHAIGGNLYNLDKSKENIKRAGRALVFESEKSVLKYRTAVGACNDISVACCGSTLSNRQYELLKKFGAKEIVLCFDKDFTDKTSEEFKKVKKKLIKQAKIFGNEITISIVFDRNDLLGYKDSPIDCGLDTFLKLFQTRIVYGWAFSH